MREKLDRRALRASHRAVALTRAVADGALCILAAAHLLAPGLAVAVALARLLAAVNVRDDAARLVDLRALDLTRADALHAAACRATGPPVAPLSAACAARRVAADLEVRVRVRVRVGVRVRVRVGVMVRVGVRVWG